MPINGTKIIKINSTTFALNYQMNKKPNKKSFVTPRVQTLFTDPVSTRLCPREDGSKPGEKCAECWNFNLNWYLVFVPWWDKDPERRAASEPPL